MRLHPVLVGELAPALGLSGVHQGVAVADLRHVDAVHETVVRLARDGDTVVLLCSPPDEREVRRQLGLLRVELPVDAVVVEPVDGVPLALWVAAHLMSVASERDADQPDQDEAVSPAAQLARLDAFRAGAISGAWLPSVTKLDRPAVTMRQHVRSWTGGSGFLVLHTPDDAAVLSCPQQELPRLPAVDGAHGAHVVTTGDPGWVLGSLKDRLGSSVTVHPLDRGWRDPRDAFGAAECVEFVRWPADLPALGAEPPGTRACPGCDRRLARDDCPFCGMQGLEPEPAEDTDAPGPTPDEHDEPDEPDEPDENDQPDATGPAVTPRTEEHQETV